MGGSRRWQCGISITSLFVTTAQPTFNDTNWVHLADEGHRLPVLDFTYPEFLLLASFLLLLLSDYALFETFPVKFFNQEMGEESLLVQPLLTSSLALSPILYFFPPKSMQDVFSWKEFLYFLVLCSLSVCLWEEDECED